MRERSVNLKSCREAYGKNSWKDRPRFEQELDLSLLFADKQRIGEAFIWLENQREDLDYPLRMTWEGR